MPPPRCAEMDGSEVGRQAGAPPTFVRSFLARTTHAIGRKVGGGEKDRGREETDAGTAAVFACSLRCRRTYTFVRTDRRDAVALTQDKSGGRRRKRRISACLAGDLARCLLDGEENCKWN